MKKLSLAVVTVLGVSAFSAVNAFETKDDAELFKERESESYLPKGIRAGSFMVMPRLDINNEYNTNIYKRDESLGTTDSYVAHFKPGVDVRSDWTRHALNLQFNSDLTEYAVQADQNNYQDLMSRVAGKLDLLRDSFLDGAFAYNSVHEDRGSPDQINGIGPTFYDNKVMNGYYNQKFNRVTLKTGMDATRFDYENVLTSTSTILEMNTRNHWEYAPSIRVGYEIQPEYEVFAKFIHKQTDYDTLVKTNGAGTAYNRNSTGYNALGGLAFDLTDLITGDFSVGYLERSYEDARLQSISGVNGFVNVKWRPTTLTNVLGRIAHDINETTQDNVSGVFATTASLNVEHELMRNVLLKGGGMIGNNDYKGHTARYNQDRQEQLYGGNIGAKYLLNRNLATDLTYQYQNRDVNAAYTGNNYDVHQIMLNLRGQF